MKRTNSHRAFFIEKNNRDVGSHTSFYSSFSLLLGGNRILRETHYPSFSDQICEIRTRIHSLIHEIRVEVSGISSSSPHVIFNTTMEKTKLPLVLNILSIQDILESVVRCIGLLDYLSLCTVLRVECHINASLLVTSIPSGVPGKNTKSWTSKIRHGCFPSSPSKIPSGVTQISYQTSRYNLRELLSTDLYCRGDETPTRKIICKSDIYSSSGRLDIGRDDGSLPRKIDIISNDVKIMKSLIDIFVEDAEWSLKHYRTADFIYWLRGLFRISFKNVFGNIIAKYAMKMKSYDELEKMIRTVDERPKICTLRDDSGRVVLSYRSDSFNVRNPLGRGVRDVDMNPVEDDFMRSLSLGDSPITSSSFPKSSSSNLSLSGKERGDEKQTFKIRTPLKRKTIRSDENKGDMTPRKTIRIDSLPSRVEWDIPESVPGEEFSTPPRIRRNHRETYDSYPIRRSLHQRRMKRKSKRRVRGAVRRPGKRLFRREYATLEYIDKVLRIKVLHLIKYAKNQDELILNLSERNVTNAILESLKWSTLDITAKVVSEHGITREAWYGCIDGQHLAFLLSLIPDDDKESFSRRMSGTSIKHNQALLEKGFYVSPEDIIDSLGSLMPYEELNVCKRIITCAPSRLSCYIIGYIFFTGRTITATHLIESYANVPDREYYIEPCMTMSTGRLTYNDLTRMFNLMYDREALRQYQLDCNASISQFPEYTPIEDYHEWFGTDSNMILSCDETLS